MVTRIHAYCSPIYNLLNIIYNLKLSQFTILPDGLADRCEEVALASVNLLCCSMAKLQTDKLDPDPVSDWLRLSWSFSSSASRSLGLLSLLVLLEDAAAAAATAAAPDRASLPLLCGAGSAGTVQPLRSVSTSCASFSCACLYELAMHSFCCVLRRVSRVSGSALGARS